MKMQISLSSFLFFSFISSGEITFSSGDAIFFQTSELVLYKHVCHDVMDIIGSNKYELGGFIEFLNGSVDGVFHLILRYQDIPCSLWEMPGN